MEAAIKDNELLLIHGTDYKEMTKKLLTAAGLARRIPRKTARIGIKPNLVSASPAKYGATTHPEVAAGILEYLQEMGYHDLVMLEGSWVGDRTEDAVKVCGYHALSERYGVPFIDTQKDGSHSRDCAGMQLAVCDSVSEIDFLINVPVLKGHCQTKITCALKNMKGLIPNREKRRFHTMGLHQPIAHLNVGIRQDFVVVDNICGDLDFEDGGNPVVMNRILAAADPVLVDAYVCDLLDYDLADVPYIGLAASLGVGSCDLGRAQIRCVNPEQTVPEVPRKRKIVELADAVEEVESCSACYGYLIPALERLRQEGLLQRLKEKIAIGQGYRGKNGPLGIGNCTRGFDCYLKGCPPTENEIYDFLKRYLSEQN